MVEFGVPFQPPRQEPSNSANVAGHGTGPVADQLADMCRGSVGGSHAITAITALRCRVEPYLDQGGACGAAGPALAPASGLREAPAVARRATPLGQQIKAAHLRAGHTADSRLPRRTSVQLAVAASRAAPLGPSPRRSALADPGPGAHSQGSAPIEEDGSRAGQAHNRSSGVNRPRAVTPQRHESEKALCGYPWEALVTVPGKPEWPVMARQAQGGAATRLRSQPRRPGRTRR